MSEDLSVLTRTAAPPDQVVAYDVETDQVADVWSAPALQQEQAAATRRIGIDHILDVDPEPISD